MQLHRFDDIKEFCDRTGAYLLQYEAEHNLLLGLSHTLLHHPDRYPNLPYLAVAEIKGEIVAVAIRTPPHKLVLSKTVEPTALELIANDLYNHQETVPGVSALVAEAQTFVKAWQTLAGQSHQLTIQMRIHQLTEVQPVATAKGFLRPATQDDRPLLLEWFQDFVDEAIPSFGEDAERLVEGSLKTQSVYLWEDGVPVSFACGSKSLPSAARIGPVYTPPEYRRKGYATACVAALSQQLLKQGCHSCFLFTDLANPTSNYIYQAIGYRPICDWHDYSFISKTEQS
jgi:predicted GNAT family acetyltransferase